MKRKAFTLIELLVTTTVLTILTGLTLTTFAGLARVQSTRTKSQTLATSALSLQDSLQADAAASSFAQVVNIGVNPGAVAYFIPAVAAQPNGAGEWRIYCATPIAGNTGYSTLNRFRVGVASYIALSGFAISCAGASFFLVQPINTEVDEVVFNDSIAIVGLPRFRVLTATGVVAPAVGEPYQAVRVDALLSALDEDVSTAQNQLPVRMTIRRNIP